MPGSPTLSLAEWIGPDGRLDILDIQQQMLDDTMRRAHDHGLENVMPARGSPIGYFSRHERP